MNSISQRTETHRFQSWQLPPPQHYPSAVAQPALEFSVALFPSSCSAASPKQQHKNYPSIKFPFNKTTRQAIAFTIFAYFYITNFITRSLISLHLQYTIIIKLNSVPNIKKKIGLKLLPKLNPHKNRTLNRYLLSTKSYTARKATHIPKRMSKALSPGGLSVPSSTINCKKWNQIRNWKRGTNWREWEGGVLRGSEVGVVEEERDREWPRVWKWEEERWERRLSESGGVGSAPTRSEAIVE